MQLEKHGHEIPRKGKLAEWKGGDAGEKPGRGRR